MLKKKKNMQSKIPRYYGKSSRNYVNADSNLENIQPNAVKSNLTSLSNIGGSLHCFSTESVNFILKS